MRGTAGVGVSVSKYIAACERVLAEAGPKTHLHAYGTNVEGEWNEVFGAAIRCHEVVHEMGAPRITTTIHLGTRTDREQTMEDKVESVKREKEAELTFHRALPEVALQGPSMKSASFKCSTQ